MTSISTPWNPATSQPASAITLRPAAASSGSSSSNSSQDSSSSTITANDFLTLLVTEMKNQDPTSTTDPNEYINQLVNVNSLQQLIQINQTLGDAIYPVSTASTTSQATVDAVPSDSASTPQTTAAPGVAHLPPSAPGNLGVPAGNPAASRIAQALTGRAL
ncbi:MAG TPA: flagellar hook capping FlgD N-terminal domain-containing protein [Terracidiphilus sp.]